MSIQNVLITLLPDPDDYINLEDRKWQDRCEKLYLEIQTKIPQKQAIIKPIIKNDAKDTRSSDIFYAWSVGIASIGGFKVIYDFLKLWVENRNENKERVSVKIKIGNNEINISNISKEEAINIFEKYIDQGQTKLKYLYDSKDKALR